MTVNSIGPFTLSGSIAINGVYENKMLMLAVLVLLVMVYKIIALGCTIARLGRQNFVCIYRLLLVFEISSLCSSI